MNKLDQEFHDFVVNFADPLTRLAFVLTAGTKRSAGSDGMRLARFLANDALAQTRRRWREVETTGAPEPIAVDVLVSGLIKRRLSFPSRQAPEELIDEVATPDNSEPVTESAPIGVQPDVDDKAVRAALWEAFELLPSRDRVPLVFADPTVASRRLDGLEVPVSIGSPRRHDALMDSALLAIREAMATDSQLQAVDAYVDSLTEGQLLRLVGEVVREHASALPSTSDAHAASLDRLRRIRLQSLLAAAAVLVLLVGVGVIAVNVSKPTKSYEASRAAAAASASAAAASASASSVFRATEPPLPAQVVPVAPVAVATTDPEQPVVAWPTRGSAASDVALVAQIEATFLEAHPDATTQAQVLAITDTPAFRIAYVTANSPNGVLQSWFSGPVGSRHLVESAFSYGGNLLPTTVLADTIANATGRTELVVIGPPDTTDMQIADFSIGAPHIGFLPLPYSAGVAVKDLGQTPDYDVALNVSVGANSYPASDLPTIQLLPGNSFDTGSAEVQRPSPAPSVLLERGTADPALVAQALLVAAAWEQPVPTAPTQPVVLWGGTDPVGTRLAVVRIKTQVFDLVIIEWSGDAPGLHGEILLDSKAPEVPLAFAYRSLQGTRIGVIGAPGESQIALSLHGYQSSSAPFDSTDFASLPLLGTGGLPAAADVNASPPPSNDVGGLIDVEISVKVLGPNGQLLTTLGVPPVL